MSFWSRFRGSGYDDEKLASSAQTAVLEDPMISKPGQINVECKDGVVTLNGSVDKMVERDHIEGAVRNSLRYHGLKFQRIENNIKVSAVAAAT